MKKLIPMALILVVAGFQAVTVAQPAHVHEHPTVQEPHSVDMKAMREEMQKKMATVKTDEERQQLMADHRKSMQDNHGDMQGHMQSHMHGHMHAQMDK